MPPGSQEGWPGGPIVSGFPPTRFVKLFAILVGLLLFVGMAAFHAVILLPIPGTPMPTDPDAAAYVLTIRALRVVFAAAMDAAVALAITCSWYWGLIRPDLTEGTRRGLLVFGTVTLAIWMILNSMSVSFRFP